MRKNALQGLIIGLFVSLSLGVLIYGTLLILGIIK